MKNFIAIPLFALAAIAGQAHAQHTGYAGQEQRAIKALSADEARQYATGAGMGYAKAAELNHYPGPMHVLELATKLELTPEQHAATQQLMDRHKAQARAIGAKLVAAEAVLDQLFSKGDITQAALAQQVQTIAALQGEYRLSHLETHRQTQALLTRQQIARYDQLRGYADGHSSRPPQNTHHH
jgi:Spy/CpxP family protein refolding chaperone